MPARPRKLVSSSSRCGATAVRAGPILIAVGRCPAARVALITRRLMQGREPNHNTPARCSDVLLRHYSPQVNQ